MRYMLKKTRVDPKQTALLIADQNSNKEDMEKIVSLAFEGIGLPSVFSIKKSILSLFANGKTSGIVLETGANITQVAPVSEGYVLHKSLLTQNIGGDTVSENIVKYIEDKEGNEQSRLEACFALSWVATDDQMKEVACAVCGAVYRFAAEDIPPTGKTVTCAKCKARVVVPPQDLPLAGGTGDRGGGGAGLAPGVAARGRACSATWTRLSTRTCSSAWSLSCASSWSSSGASAWARDRKSVV